jgi:uncharacterized protein (TIGR03067 family)
MKTWLGLTTLSALALATSVAAETPIPKAKDDPAAIAVGKLVGAYKVLHYETQGQQWSAEQLKEMKVVMSKGDAKGHVQATFRVGEDSTDSKCDVLPGGRYGEVDATYTNGPSKGKTVKGIYTVDGDKITFCYAAIDKKRPNTFSSKGDDGRTLYVLSRVKE